VLIRRAWSVALAATIIRFRVRARVERDLGFRSTTKRVPAAVAKASISGLRTSALRAWVPERTRASPDRSETASTNVRGPCRRGLSTRGRHARDSWPWDTRNRLPAYEKLKRAGRETRISSPTCRKSAVGAGGAVLPGPGVPDGACGEGLLFSGRPSRISTTCAGIVFSGMWMSQAAISVRGPPVVCPYSTASVSWRAWV
jgi:hypothetical protein